MLLNKYEGDARYIVGQNRGKKRKWFTDDSVHLEAMHLRATSTWTALKQYRYDIEAGKKIDVSKIIQYAKLEKCHDAGERNI